VLGDDVVQLLTKVLEVLQVDLEVVAPLLRIVEQALAVDKDGAHAKVADEALGVLLHVAVGQAAAAARCRAGRAQALRHCVHVPRVPLHGEAGYNCGGKPLEPQRAASSSSAPRWARAGAA
jgi:hypothetical protein